MAAVTADVTVDQAVAAELAELRAERDQLRTLVLGMAGAAELHAALAMADTRAVAAERTSGVVTRPRRPRSLAAGAAEAAEAAARTADRPPRARRAANIPE